MEYQFYTPPNTETSIDYSVPFDQELALLEGHHYMAEQEIEAMQRQWEQRVTDLDNANLDAMREMRVLFDARIAERRDRLAEIEGEVARIRADRQEAWDRHRAEVVANQGVTA